MCWQIPRRELRLTDDESLRLTFAALLLTALPALANSPGDPINPQFQSLVVGGAAPTGGGEGDGSINAKSYYINGVPFTGGGVASLGNATSDTTLTLTGTGSGPYTGTVTAKINLSNANSWAAVQTFGSGDLLLSGSSSGGEPSMLPPLLQLMFGRFPPRRTPLRVSRLRKLLRTRASRVAKSTLVWWARLTVELESITAPTP